MISVYSIDVYTIKYADQVILIVVFTLTLLAFLAHILFALRYRYAWHRLSTGVNASARLNNDWYLFVDRDLVYHLRGRSVLRIDSCFGG